MGIIRYTKTYFNEPGRINEVTYQSLKIELNRNPNYKIDPNPETFSEHFSGILKVIKICGGVIVGALFFSFVLGIDKRGDVLAPIAGIAFLILFFSLIPLFLEGPSYATYVKQKKEYYGRMKYAIQNTSSYYEFMSIFYS